MWRAVTRIGMVAMVLGGAGCTITRSYWGSPLRGDPSAIVEGRTTKAEVLRMFGPPDKITHQTDGDVFTYTYWRRNYSSFTVQEPVITQQRLFTYARQFDNRDALVVLFDFGGVVRGHSVDLEVDDMPAL